MIREKLLRADNDWLRQKIATNMIYKKEADELRAEVERLKAERNKWKAGYERLAALTGEEPKL
jgi:FtsZ-binding cell division protein ZapB